MAPLLWHLLFLLSSFCRWQLVLLTSVRAMVLALPLGSLLVLFVEAAVVVGARKSLRQMSKVFWQLYCVHKNLLPVVLLRLAIAVSAVVSVAQLACSVGTGRLPVALVAQEGVRHHADQVQLDEILLHELGVQNLLAGRTSLGVHAQELADYVVEVVAVLDRDA